MKRNRTWLLAFGFLLSAPLARAQTPVPPSHSVNVAGGMVVAIPEDRIETSRTVPARVVEVTTLDPRGIPMPQVLVELFPGRQRAVSDDQGRLQFTNVPESREATYRLVTVVDGARLGSRPFAVDSSNGTKAVLHVYPVIREVDETLVIGQSFWYIEPRDDVVYFELLTEFRNLAASTWVPEGVELTLPEGSTAFATTGGDPDIVVKETPHGTRLVGAVGPGQHAVTFSFQIPSNNESAINWTLPLWPHTAAVRVATLSRPYVGLSVEGYPETQLVQSKGQAPLLMTSRTYTQEASGPPRDLRVTLRGLPVTGPGRLVAAALSALLVLGALLWSWLRDLQGKASGADAGEREARERLLDELAELTRAHRTGLVGDETFAETQQALVTACIRLERKLTTS